MRNINSIKYNSVLAILAFVVVFVLLIASAPAQASETLQVTPEVTVIVPTVVVPNTGGENTQVVNVSSSWVLWVILGVVVVIALVVALIARPTHIHHDDL